MTLLKSNKKPCKYFYKLYLENIRESPVRSQNKWAQELGVHMDDWMYIYSPPFMAILLWKYYTSKLSVKTFP